jgi:serine/threonine-protein kinase
MAALDSKHPANLRAHRINHFGARGEGASQQLQPAVRNLAGAVRFPKLFAWSSPPPDPRTHRRLHWGEVAENDDIGAARTRAASTPPPPPSSGEQAPTLLANRYTIIGLLGMGGMGRVYRAHDGKLDEVVALKMLRKELVGRADMLDRFRQEVKLARRVTSPHVVRTFDLGEHGDEVFLTMEYIEGSSLAHRIENGPMPVDEVLRIGRAVAAGMAAAHATGVLHRDLKPDNILLGKDGRIAITDFGIARSASASPDATADRFVGTPAYMAPEQVESVAKLTPAVDVYAFGAIVFEMLTSRRPFVASNALAVAVARLLEPPPDPRALRPLAEPIASFVRRCLAREAEGRFSDGAALEAALASLAAVSTSTLPVASRPVVPERSARSVAIVPLRASGDLAEVADGLGEEIVDALSMSRQLRVRPFGALRSSAADADPTELGRTLGVDVVVEGSIRRRGDRVRVAARVISVADAFQLWANHVDAAADGLLAACDEIVQAIAKALTVDISLPARAPLLAEFAALFLEAKAQLRARWSEGNVESVLAELDQAVAQVPNDPSLVALLATTLARTAFFGATANLTRARHLAERAVAMAPQSGDAQLALAFSALYSGDSALAAGAFARVVRHAPGHAMGQALLGAMLLDAGALEDGIAHLEAAVSIDPASLQATDLARAYCYQGRFDEGIDILRKQPQNLFVDYLIARLELWRGRRHELGPIDRTALSPLMILVSDVGRRTYGSGQVTDEDIAAFDEIAVKAPMRWRAAQTQYIAEMYASVGMHDRAIGMVRVSIDSGLHDICWIDRCPAIEPLRSHPDFAPLADVVRRRAMTIVAAIRDAMA